ncbi:haloacid dehalogenase superfamily enzyme, subfamily IA,REG-2-like HAD hydrolase, subfamily IA [Synechococcus sp. PCC 7502]|uniref:HAD-IA family hydrolase n=1 Tax=Synechococcus sp. PCC 7502 TaxID=1173263 RepID=UPI00029FBAFD|nr:HAD-IA family hydrolase [Synechococcus sp. PCC 7502]AFY74821.1 haloacid dehalogenase superfamily enzyme, subfamily IA,REG-2-like HAD hydrolase, subfamily IA [Synechococcus sp. PCC 7502]
MLFPKVIFFDAVGTLFGVQGSVGTIYSTIAHKYGVNAKFEDLDQAFFHDFKTAPKMAFPDVDRSQIPEYEYQWWRNIAKSTFNQVGALQDFKDFDAYFQEMYDFFATPEAWYIYEDVVPTLTYLQNQGVTLGIISNFDHRIYAVLESLELHNFFASITISTQVGAAKPDSQIFQAAIAKHQEVNPDQSHWHIGDSYKEDYEGAIKANLVGIWLNRYSSSEVSDRSINSLNFTISSMQDLISKVNSLLALN